MPLTVEAIPNPFRPPGTCTLTVSGGTAPYTFVAITPPGASALPSPSNGTTQVSVPPGTPVGTPVAVVVTDAAGQTVSVRMTVG